MATSANVRSVQALRQFRAALLRFCEIAGRALGEAESEINRTVDWVEHTQSGRWRREVSSRSDDIASARAAVFRREMRSMSDNPGATEERQNLTSAKVRLRDAEERTRAIKAWSRRLREEADRYHAMAERLSTAATVELPEAAVRLARMIESLEAYLAIAGPAAGRGDGRSRNEARPAGEAGSMAQPLAEGPSLPPHAPHPWAHLRERAAAIPSPPPGVPAEQPPHMESSDLAARLGGQRLEPLEAGASVVVEEAAFAEREFFLLRRAAGDGTEWVVGWTDARPPGPAVRLPAGTVARRLGDLASVLHLPAGWLAVIREGRLRLVVDAEDRERLQDREVD